MIPDISHYHPVNDWVKASENCEFIISKATQGTSMIDSTLKRFVNGCENHGIPYWLYTYLNAGNELAQTKYMVEVCRHLVGSHFVGYVLDVEAGNSAGGVRIALDYLQGLGRSMLYTMYAQNNTYKSVIQSRGAECAWWEARYGRNNGSYSVLYPAHSGADLHQYTSVGTCPGVAGNADLNRVCGAKSLSWFQGQDDLEPTNKITGKGTGEDMQCTFQIDGKTTVYWYDGEKIVSLYNIDQLRVIQRIFKACNGRDLPHYKWTSNAPWYLRLQQAINRPAIKFEEVFPTK